MASPKYEQDEAAIAMRYPTKFGKYLLLDRINVGGMAEVYLAKAFGVEGFERILAIKRILPNMAEDDEFINMFVDEARIAVQLAHANIVQIYELGKFDEQYYIAMEYVAGKDLRQLLDYFRKSDQVMPLPMAAFIAAKICDGLDHAHRKADPTGKPLNLIHRDVSPQNILVSYEGDVKVTDFGIAKAEDRASKTQAGVLKGKFGYMSPEQVRGLDIDYRSDIFAVGILLYEMVTGKRLFIGESDFSTLEKVRNADVTPPTQLNPDIPPELEQIMLKALAKERDERYQQASDLHDDLQQFLIVDNSIYNAKRLSATLKEIYADAIAESQKKMEDYMQVRAGGAGPQQAAPEDTVPEDIKEKTVIFESGFNGDDLSSMPTAMGNVADFAPPKKAKSGGNTSADPTELPTAISHVGSMDSGGTADPVPRAMPKQTSKGGHTGVQRRAPPRNAIIIGGAAVVGLLLLLLVLLLTPGGSDLGTIVVESSPVQDVEIYLDDTLIAKQTPFVKADVPLGEHILVARAAGFKDKAYRFELVAGASAKINVQLDAARLQNGRVVIATEPSGVEVHVAGELQGKTPLTLSELDRSEPIKLELRKKGYHVQVIEVAFDDDEEEKTIAETLKPLAGKIVVTSKPEGASVSVNDAQRGQTPLELTDLLPNRNYKIVVEKDGYKPFSQSIDLDGKDVTVRAELAVATASQKQRRQRTPSCSGTSALLSVATPGEANCTVKVGRSDLGVAPFFKKPAPAGRCSVSITCPSGKKLSKSMSLAAGNEEKLIVRSDMWK